THVCDGTPPPPPPGGELAQGVTETFSGASGSETEWFYNTPANVDTVSFDMNGGTGDADVYVKFGSSPTSTSYDCRPYAAGNSEACNFSSGQEGTYYVMVHAYSSYSNVNLTADHTTGGTPPPPPPPGEGDSGTVTDINVPFSQWQRWEVEVPAGATNFVVTTTGGTGDGDLYVKQGSAPTSSSYDCRPFDYGNEEICTIATPDAGTMHIAIYGYSNATGVTMSWSYE
ncbi:MAG: pre-peptidase C-terminal domain-containing protein, partial [Algicola sp.]|nr:pre-peptidase C-terminal domain-containing protein [Algicola sp.]